MKVKSLEIPLVLHHRPGYSRPKHRWELPGSDNITPVICANELLRYFAVPKEVKKIFVILSNKKLPASFEVTTNVYGDLKIKVVGGWNLTPSFYEASEILRNFGTPCYVRIEYEYK